MARKVRNAKKVQAKARTHQVRKVADHVFAVESGETHETYVVRTSRHGATCTCDWAKYRPRMDPRSACSHSQAAFKAEFGEQGVRVSFWSDPEQVARQHRHAVEIGDGVVMTTRKDY